MSGCDYAIVGVGAVTPLGTSAASSAAAVRAGISGFEEHPFMIDRQGEPIITARVSRLEDASLRERMIDMGVSAACEAIDDFGQLSARFDTTLFLALPSERPGWLIADCDPVREAIYSRLKNVQNIAATALVRDGHAAGLLALSDAITWIEKGRAEVCLVGGVDSYESADLLEYLDEGDQLHSPSNPVGFVPGEGAGFCVIVSARMATKLGIQPLAFVGSIHLAHEEHTINSEQVCLGVGLTEAVAAACTALPAGQQVSRTICDLNGEPYRADEFGYTVVRTSSYFQDVTDVDTPADCWGDMGVASGPLFISLVAAARRKRYAKGLWSLIWASSESGERGCALLNSA